MRPFNQNNNGAQGYNRGGSSRVNAQDADQQEMVDPNIQLKVCEIYTAEMRCS